MNNQQETKVSIDSKNLNTARRRAKAQRVAKQFHKIINSMEFAEEIMKMNEDWRVGETSHLKNLTNIEILRLIRSGKEEWNGIVDYEIDLLVDDYTRNWSSVVGYMVPGKPTVWVNTKFFDTMDDKRVGSNFLHEYGHTLGMRHGGPDFRMSLAYYLNQAYERTYDRIITEDFTANEPNGYWICIPRWQFWKYAFSARTRCRWQVLQMV